LLLRKISNGSFTEAQQIFKENVTTVKAIFSSLPPVDELEKIIRGEESDEAYTDENSEPENENSESWTSVTDLSLAKENDVDHEDAPKDPQEDKSLSESFSESSSEDEN
jgi:hypothetical protein